VSFVSPVTRQAVQLRSSVGPLAVLSSPLVPAISGGDYRSVIVDQALLLDASSSSDPDSPVLPALLWSCALVTSDSRALATGYLASASPSQVSALIGLTNRSCSLPPASGLNFASPVLAVPASSLTPYSVYAFAVTLAPGSSRQATSGWVLVEALPVPACPPPAVQLLSSSPLVVNPNDVVRVRVAATSGLSTLPGDLQYHWSVLSVSARSASSTGGGAVTPAWPDLTSSRVVSSSINTSSLVISPGVLTKDFIYRSFSFPATPPSDSFDICGCPCFCCES